MRSRWFYLAGIACLGGLAIYLAQPPSETVIVDRPNTEFDRDAMMSSPHPVVYALRSSTLQIGSSEEQLLAIQDPLWQQHYGRYRIFGYDPERSYDYTVVCTLDGKVASAGTGSCLWRWQFFDNIPLDIIHARRALDRYRAIVADDPAMAEPLASSFDSVYGTLGMDLDAKEGEPSVRPETSKTSSGDG